MMIKYINFVLLLLLISSTSALLWSGGSGSVGGNGTTINNYITNGSVLGTGENTQIAFWNDTLNNRTLTGNNKLTYTSNNAASQLVIGNTTMGYLRLSATNIIGVKQSNIGFNNGSTDVFTYGYNSNLPEKLLFSSTLANVNEFNFNKGITSTENITGKYIFGDNLCYTNGSGCLYYNQSYESTFNSTYQTWAYNQSIDILPLNNIFAGNNSFRGLNTNFERINVSQVNVSGRIDIVSPVNSVGNLFIKRSYRYLATIGDAGDGLTSALRMYGNGTANQYVGEVSINDVSIANYPSENRVLGILARKMGTQAYKLAFTQRQGSALKTAFEIDTSGNIYFGATDWASAWARLDVDGNVTVRGNAYFYSDVNVSGLFKADNSNLAIIYNNIISDQSGQYVLDSNNHVLKDVAQGDNAIDFFDATALKLSYYTTDGFIKTSNGDGTLVVDTTTYADILGDNIFEGNNIFTGNNSFSGINNFTENNIFIGNNTFSGINNFTGTSNYFKHLDVDSINSTGDIEAIGANIKITSGDFYVDNVIGFSGSCINTQYSGGIALWCND